MFSNSKMSQIDPRGGGQHFSNQSQIKKSLKYPIGGGGQAYLGHCPKFSCFLIMTPPLSLEFDKNVLKTNNVKIGFDSNPLFEKIKEKKPNNSH